MSWVLVAASIVALCVAQQSSIIKAYDFGALRFPPLAWSTDDLLVLGADLTPSALAGMTASFGLSSTPGTIVASGVYVIAVPVEWNKEGENCGFA